MSAGALPSTTGRPALSLFFWALLISILFHLSAITLFRIVIYFPQQTTQYYALAFLEELAMSETVPVPESAMIAALTGPRAVRSAELPKLAFDPQGQLEIGRLRLGGRSFYNDLSDAAPRLDSWERFGEGVQSVRASLLSLAGAPVPNDMPRDAGGEDLLAQSKIGLGPDLSGELDWSGSGARELISAPPALFQRDVPAFNGEYLLNVAPDGAVRSVISLNTEPSGLESGVRAYLERCRVAPDLSATRDVAVNLRVRANSLAGTP